MTTKSKGAILQWSLAVLLLGVFGVAVAQLAKRDENDPSVQREALEERVAKYCELRIRDDAAALYDLVDPRIRLKMTSAKFVGFYGQGFLRVHALTGEVAALDPVRETATVRFHFDQELAVEKLPANARKNLKNASPSDVRQKGTYEVTWRRRDRVWYFEPDQEVIRGKSSTGEDIHALEPGSTANNSAGSTGPGGAESRTAR
jgi:hypothetical protein